MLRFLVITISLLFLLAVAGIASAGYVFWHYGRGLPDYRALADYEPPITTRLYAGDGRLMTEYAVQKRVFVPIEAIPRRVIDAFLSAEDQNFYQHPGIDPMGLARAVVTNLRNFGSGRRPEGASTITQQVAKNFLLTNEVSIERKIKEAILAMRIEQTFSKDHILELYLNEIYLGYGSYGVATAAMNYFNKSLDQLTTAEAAFLAALPKAPNNYNPIREHDAAVARRNWVISRLAEDGHITRAEAEQAQAEPLIVRSRDTTEYVSGGDYFAEEVRREIVETFGEKALYEGGLAVRTTLDPKLQALAEKSLRKGLLAYDQRHGFRGPVAQIGAGEGWQQRLAQQSMPAGALDDWRLAVVLESAKDARIGFSDGSTAEIPYGELKWGRAVLKDQRFGNVPKSAADVVGPGDVVLVEQATDKDGEARKGVFALRQIPNVNGGLVAMDPHTGRVLAMAGGWSYAQSEFNRATQALRQPGSAFKPFVYLTALEQGYTPSTLVLDAPFVYDQGPGLPKWKPKNYSGNYYGPSTLRTGIEHSRNLMTVRLAQAVGMNKIAETAETFGIDDNFPRVLAASLGAGDTSVLRLTTAYAMLANGGKRVTPSLIDRIQDRKGKTIFKHDARPCKDCRDVFWTSQDMPQIPDIREQIAEPRSVYQIVHIMEGVIKYGTGRRLAYLNVPMAGKTGTTNDSLDTWFMGFTPDMVVGTFVGFDEPRTLGSHETGSATALPVFQAFMDEALKDKPVRPFAVPPGIQLVRVDHKTGRLAQYGDDDVILEAFKTGSTPSYTAGPVLDGSSTIDPGTDVVVGDEVFGPGDVYTEDGGDGTAAAGAGTDYGVPTAPRPSAGSNAAQPQAGGLY